jgi:hypothetical protein
VRSAPVIFLPEYARSCKERNVPMEGRSEFPCAVLQALAAAPTYRHRHGPGLDLSVGSYTGRRAMARRLAISRRLAIVTAARKWLPEMGCFGRAILLPRCSVKNRAGVPSVVPHLDNDSSPCREVSAMMHPLGVIESSGSTSKRLKETNHPQLVQSKPLKRKHYSVRCSEVDFLVLRHDDGCWKAGVTTCETEP